MPQLRNHIDRLLFLPMKNIVAIVGEDPACPIYGPRMKVLKTGEVCELDSFSGRTYPELRFKLKFKDGSVRDFARQEVESVD